MRIIQGIGTKKIGEEGLLSCGHFLTPVSKTPRSTPNLPIPKSAEEKKWSPMCPKNIPSLFHTAKQPSTYHHSMPVFVT